MYSIEYTNQQKNSGKNEQLVSKCTNVLVYCCTQAYTLDMSETSPFAARLREARAAAKMTQHELAERSGIHRQAIAKLELGDRQPTWETVQALARALGVDCKVFETQSAEAEMRRAKKTRKRKGET